MNKIGLLSLMLISFFTLIYISGCNTEEKEPLPQVEADFTASETTIKENVSINFQDNSTGTPTSWRWTFEGGKPSSSTEQNPTVTYENAGNYEVTLEASNAGNSDIVTKSGFISVYSLIKAEFSVEEDTVVAGSVVQFQDKSIGGPTSWEWSFEGGTPESSAKQNPSIVFEEAGKYTVSLKSGHDQDENKEIKEDFIVVYESITAQFSLEKSLYYIGEKITVSDSSSGNPTSWQWYFENADPQESTDKEPTFTFTAEGEQKIVLIASNEFTSDTLTRSVTVNEVEPLKADFNYELNYEYISHIGVSFKDATEGNPTEWQWIFEHADTSNTVTESQNPSVFYVAPGEYKVTLIVSNASVKDTVSKTIEVTEGKGEKFLEFETKEYDFGDITDIVEYDFEFENVGPSVVSILGASAYAPYSEVLVTTDVVRPSYLPGNRGRINVRVNPQKLEPGPYTFYVGVHTTAPGSPQQLIVKANVLEDTGGGEVIDTCAYCPDEGEVTGEIYMVVEEQPLPAGGMDAFYEYINENSVYPDEALDLGIEGKVFVQFIVEKDGKISCAEAIKGIGAGCDEEAVRLIQCSANWKPGKQRGKPVRVRMVLPITFRLPD